MTWCWTRLAAHGFTQRLFRATPAASAKATGTAVIECGVNCASNCDNLNSPISSKFHETSHELRRIVQRRTGPLCQLRRLLSANEQASRSLSCDSVAIPSHIGSLRDVRISECGIRLSNKLSCAACSRAIWDSNSVRWHSYPVQKASWWPMQISMCGK